MAISEKLHKTINVILLIPLAFSMGLVKPLWLNVAVSSLCVIVIILWQYLYFRSMEPGDDKNWYFINRFYQDIIVIMLLAFCYYLRFQNPQPWN